MSDEALMKLVTEAFPIIVFAKQLDDKKRKVMEILECEICPDGKRKYHSLFRYDIKENKREDDRSVIIGEHVKCEPVSESLKNRFISNGMPGAELEKMCGELERENHRRLSLLAPVNVSYSPESIVRLEDLDERTDSGEGIVMNKIENILRDEILRKEAGSDNA